MGKLKGCCLYPTPRSSVWHGAGAQFALIGKTLAQNNSLCNPCKFLKGNPEALNRALKAEEACKSRR